MEIDSSVVCRRRRRSIATLLLLAWAGIDRFRQLRRAGALPLRGRRTKPIRHPRPAP